MMDDLGLEDVSFDESFAQPGQMIGATPYKAPDSARVSVLFVSCMCVNNLTKVSPFPRYCRLLAKFSVLAGGVYLMHLFGVNP